MKITAFLGSPRARGNTDILAERLLDGARDAGWETESVALRSLKIRGCIACESCWRDGKPCAINDDMQELYNTIASSDVLVFATPVYWYAPTAIMKAFIDRLVPFNRPKGRPLVKGKSVIVVTAYEEEGPEAAETLLRVFEMSFAYLEVINIGTIIVDGVGPKGAVLDKAEVLDNAYQLGRSLQL
jgi:multimeric flavodoxin WrbA